MGIKRIWGALVFLSAGMAAGNAARAYQDRPRQAEIKKYGDKYYEYFQLLNRWMAARNEGKQVADFFGQENIHTVAIYGMGNLADRLAEELEGSGIHVMYGIDRDVCCTNARVADIYPPSGSLPEVDAIVITPFLSAGEIGKSLEGKHSSRLVPLDDIIYSL